MKEEAGGEETRGEGEELRTGCCGTERNGLRRKDENDNQRDFGCGISLLEDQSQGSGFSYD